MTTDPARPGDDDPGFEPVEEGYGFADPEPPSRPVSLPPVDDAPPREEHEISLEEETRPRRRRKRPRHEDEPDGEPIPAPEEPGDRILRREEVVSPPTWWVVPTVLFVIGFLLSLIPVGVVAVKVGVAAGAVAFGLIVVGLVLQVVAVTVLLILVGGLFGIDYGPAIEAVVKLAAVVAVVDGLTALMLFTCSPLGLMVAAMIGAGVFQYLFRLSIHEMLLSVAPMVAAAWVVNASVFAIVLKKEQKKKDAPTGFRLLDINAKTTVDAPASPFPSRPRLFPPFPPVSRRFPPC